MVQDINVAGVSKWYGEDEDTLQVLDDIDFDVEQREFVVIVGPSGCGKTTLLHIIDGLVQPSDGEVRVGGTAVREPRQEMAMVFQSFELFPWRSIVENVALGLEIQGYSKSERREIALEWIDRVGLNGFEESYPDELSGGMQQRVGLARALAVDPDVLLMDEPFGALDAQTKDQMQTELLQIWEDQRKTVVFITHDISEAIFLGDRVLVMSQKPAGIVRDISIDFERPRWDRRLEVERDDRFQEIERQIRQDLGLTVTDDGEEVEL